MKTLGLVLLALFLSAAGAFAADQVQAALYWGHNDPPPLMSRLAPADLNQRLEQVFGFRYYQLVQIEKIELRHTWAQWFIPRRDLFICLKPLRPQLEEPQLVDYEIYQQGFILAKGKYEPSEETPLFINGPDFKKGRLIFVLEAR